MGAREDAAGGSGYGTTTTAKEKYNLTSRTYPEDLFDNSSKYGNAWVMININVLNTTKADGTKNEGDDKKYDEIPLDEWEKKNFTDFNDRQSTGSPQLDAATVTAMGAVVGGVKSFISSGGNKVSTAVGAAQGGVATGLALAPLLGGNTRTTSRIKTAIMLPMPNELSTSYSMQWNEDSTKLLDLAMRFPHLTVDAIKNAFTGSMSSMAADAATSLSLGLNSAVGGSGVSAATGLASNPKKEQIFNGVNFRSFTMNYTFYPKSASEALAIHNIIYELKYHMHPEYKSAGRFTFIYPSEFDITFYTGEGRENLWVSRIATCVLKDLAVNYAPSGKWVGKDNGFPNAIQISMVFQELSILTKESITKGF